MSCLDSEAKRNGSLSISCALPFRLLPLSLGLCSKGRQPSMRFGPSWQMRLEPPLRCSLLYCWDCLRRRSLTRPTRSPPQDEISLRRGFRPEPPSSSSQRVMNSSQSPPGDEETGEGDEALGGEGCFSCRTIRPRDPFFSPPQDRSARLQTSIRFLIEQRQPSPLETFPLRGFAGI